MSDTAEQRVAAAVATTASAAGEMIAELEREARHWRAEATDATRIMHRRGEHVRELKVRIQELEEKLFGTLARRCHIPGCDASYNAADGPPPHESTLARHWLQNSTPALLLCPDHTHLWSGDTPHRPGLDHATRTAACSCGHPLPGPTLGHMGTAWIAHALALEEQPAATWTPRAIDRLADDARPTTERRGR